MGVQHIGEVGDVGPRNVSEKLPQERMFPVLQRTCVPLPSGASLKMGGEFYFRGLSSSKQKSGLAEKSHSPAQSLAYRRCSDQ